MKTMGYTTFRGGGRGKAAAAVKRSLQGSQKEKQQKTGVAGHYYQP